MMRNGLILSAVLCFILSSAFVLQYSPLQKPNTQKGFDTCYYFLSGGGLVPIGPTILSIKTVDCSCSSDSIDVILNQNLIESFPDNYFMLENRKRNGPFKDITDAENEILRLRNIKSINK